MTLPKSCEGWLVWLSQQRPSEADWDDPEYLHLLSWAMLMFIPRRLGQLLIDAGEAVDVRPEYRS